MSYCCYSIPRRFLRASVPTFICGALSLALAFGVGDLAVGQPASKGTKKAAGPPADSSPTSAGQQSEVEVLIGDAVENANSPQYQKVSDAIEMFKKRRVKEARDLLIEARTAHRQLPPAEVLIAKLFILARQPQLALAELEQAVNKHPNDPEAYLMFADGSLADGHITAAEALYRDADALVKAFNENPKRKDNFEKRVLQGVAAVAQSRQHWQVAEKLLRQLIKLDPENSVAQQRLGVVLFQQATPNDRKTLGEAYNAFNAAIAANPRMAPPDLAMGQLFEQAAQQALNAGDKAKFNQYRQQAIDSFKRATTANANYTPSLGTLLTSAMWALQINDFKTAQQYAQAAMKNDPDSVDARLIAAVVARFSGDLATAERLLQEAYNQSPANFAVSNQLALVLAESNDKSKRDRALDLAKINAGLNENSAEAVSTLGWVLYQLGQKSQAQQVLQNVVNSRALTPDSAYYVAYIFADQGRNVEAMQILENALGVPQPFANRTKATELMDDLRKKVEAGDAAADGKAGASDTSSKGGARPTGATKKSK